MTCRNLVVPRRASGQKCSNAQGKLHFTHGQNQQRSSRRKKCTTLGFVIFVTATATTRFSSKLCAIAVHVNHVDIPLYNTTIIWLISAEQKRQILRNMLGYPKTWVMVVRRLKMLFSKSWSGTSQSWPVGLKGLRVFASSLGFEPLSLED